MPHSIASFAIKLISITAETIRTAYLSRYLTDDPDHVQRRVAKDTIFREMRIQVRYFASLRERLGKAGEIVDLPGSPLVQDLWAEVGCEADTQVLAAVNLEYAPFARPLRDGDEVAFFPPVTGG